MMMQKIDQEVVRPALTSLVEQPFPQDIPAESKGAGFDLTQNFKRIPDRLFFRIGDVADLLDVKPYVLRYWESEFTMIAPQKSSAGQRVYRRIDVETVMLIKHLLYTERYSIEGARKKIKELRKDGDLQNFKQANVLAPEPAGLNPETAKKLTSLAKQLKATSKVSIRELFKY